MSKYFYLFLALTALSILSVLSSCRFMLAGGGSYAAFSSLPSVEEDAFNERVIDEDEYLYVVVDNARSVRKNDKLDYLLYSRELGPGPGNGCKVSASRNSTEDLYCMLDVLEGDLFLQDIELEYSVPKGMCNYLEFKLPWHYNQKIGLGPPRIYSCGEGEDAQYYDKPLNWSGAGLNCESGSLACSTGSSPTSCSEGSDGAVTPNCGTGEAYCSTGEPERAVCAGEGSARSFVNPCGPDGQPQAFTCAEGQSFTPASCAEGTLSCVGGELVCKADKAPICACPGGGESNKTAFCNKNTNPEEHLDRTEEGLANCCFGNHDTTEYKRNQATGGFTKGKGTKEDWGGVFHQCIGGLAKVNGVQIGNITGGGGQINFAGVPAGLVTPSFSGEQENYTIPHIRSFDPISEIRAGNTLRSRINRIDKRKSLSLATCWGDDSGPDGCKVQDDGWPDKLYIANDPSLRGVPGVFGHPFISWSCLDAGYEVRHRIHLIVREWNTEKEFLDYQNSQGSNGDANYSQDSDSCDYYNPEDWISPEPQCNDLQDVEDLRGDYPEVRYCKYKLDNTIQADTCAQAR